MNKQFCRFLVPERELCVDETLVATKGVDNISIKVLRNNVSFMHVPVMYVRFWRSCVAKFIEQK
jgi:hypothetical protein